MRDSPPPGGGGPVGDSGASSGLGIDETDSATSGGVPDGGDFGALSGLGVDGTWGGIPDGGDLEALLGPAHVDGKHGGGGVIRGKGKREAASMAQGGAEFLGLSAERPGVSLYRGTLSSASEDVVGGAESGRENGSPDSGESFGSGLLDSGQNGLTSLAAGQNADIEDCDFLRRFQNPEPQTPKSTP